MAKQSLQLQQLNNKMRGLAALRKVAMPPTGWIKAIRTALGMSMQQLGNKLNVSRQGVMDMEKREKDGSISIRSLREIAGAMDMQLVYAFVPNDGSLDALIEKRATALATEIVMRTAQTMQLENQANSEKRIQAAIRERATAIQNEMPKILWD
ncbi:MAG TPA: mobile mystery protein A [Chitinophagaceae bacterium]|nr:mobile mystery protein A [Chitinophagaceae bacterium]